MNLVVYPMSKYATHINSKLSNLFKMCCRSGRPIARRANVPVQRLRCMMIKVAAPPSMDKIGSNWSAQNLGLVRMISAAVRPKFSTRV